jgi:hypothetical protein
LLEDKKHVLGETTILVILRTAKDALGTKPRGFKAGHAGLDAIIFGETVGGDDDAVATAPATDPDGTLLKLGVQCDFATGEKTIAVYVEDAVHLAHARTDYFNAKKTVAKWEMGKNEN